MIANKQIEASRLGCAKEPTSDQEHLILRKSLLHYIRQSGAALDERTAPFSQWINLRRSFGIWPYARTMHSQPAFRSRIGHELTGEPRDVTNFGSQDYLGLSSCKDVIDTAKEAIDTYGIHSAGSGALCGRTNLLVNLEHKLASLLGKEACLVFPTGWAAGFGVPSGLIRSDDMVLLDALSHNCLQEGCRHATSHLQKFRHNDLGHLEELLISERARSVDKAVFVVLESLYSMDSDSPDLLAAMKLAKRFDAIVILDIAHDFGSMGQSGLGVLETIPASLFPDVILGSFSKTFACNGGFAACSESVKQYLMFYSAPHVFSNAHSPLQSAIALKCLEIAFSQQGAGLRNKLRGNVMKLRTQMKGAGYTVGGEPSPIVPVFIDSEESARLVSREISEQGLLANLVEYPAVPRGKARFRFQVMSTHSSVDIGVAAAIMKSAKKAVTSEAKLVG